MKMRLDAGLAREIMRLLPGLILVTDGRGRIVAATGRMGENPASNGGPYLNERGDPAMPSPALSRGARGVSRPATAATAVPAGGESRGRLVSKARETVGAFTVSYYAEEGDLERLEQALDEYHDAVRGELAAVIEAKTQSLEKLTCALVAALEDASFYHSHTAKTHLSRVKRLAFSIALEAGLPRDYCEKVRLYSTIHDIGMVGIPDRLLDGRRVFSPEESALMRQHVLIGDQMLSRTEIDPIARNIALYHHEKWNGSGYCAGLRGEAIPLEARIVAIADAFDSACTTKGYKPGCSVRDAVVEIEGGAGKDYDPALVENFSRIASSFI